MGFQCRPEPELVSGEEDRHSANACREKKQHIRDAWVDPPSPVFNGGRMEVFRIKDEKKK